MTFVIVCVFDLVRRAFMLRELGVLICIPARDLADPNLEAQRRKARRSARLLRADAAHARRLRRRLRSVGRSCTITMCTSSVPFVACVVVVVSADGVTPDAGVSDRQPRAARAAGEAHIRHGALHAPGPRHVQFAADDGHACSLPTLSDNLCPSFSCGLHSTTGRRCMRGSSAGLW